MGRFISIVLAVTAAALLFAAIHRYVPAWLGPELEPLAAREARSRAQVALLELEGRVGDFLREQRRLAQRAVVRLSAGEPPEDVAGETQSLTSSPVDVAVLDAGGTVVARAGDPVDLTPKARDRVAAGQPHVAFDAEGRVVTWWPGAAWVVGVRAVPEMAGAGGALVRAGARWNAGAVEVAALGPPPEPGDDAVQVRRAGPLEGTELVARAAREELTVIPFVQSGVLLVGAAVLALVFLATLLVPRPEPAAAAGPARTAPSPVEAAGRPDAAPGDVAAESAEPVAPRERVQPVELGAPAAPVEGAEGFGGPIGAEAAAGTEGLETAAEPAVEASSEFEAAEGPETAARAPASPRVAHDVGEPGPADRSGPATPADDGAALEDVYGAPSGAPEAAGGGGTEARAAALGARGPSEDRFAGEVAPSRDRDGEVAARPEAPGAAETGPPPEALGEAELPLSSRAEAEPSTPEPEGGAEAPPALAEPRTTTPAPAVSPGEESAEWAEGPGWSVPRPPEARSLEAEPPELPGATPPEPWELPPASAALDDDPSEAAPASPWGRADPFAAPPETVRPPAAPEEDAEAAAGWQPVAGELDARLPAPAAPEPPTEPTPVPDAAPPEARTDPGRAPAPEPASGVGFPSATELTEALREASRVAQETRAAAPTERVLVAPGPTEGSAPAASDGPVSDAPEAPSSDATADAGRDATVTETARPAPEPPGAAEEAAPGAASTPVSDALDRPAPGDLGSGAPRSEAPAAEAASSTEPPAAARAPEAAGPRAPAASSETPDLGTSDFIEPPRTPFDEAHYRSVFEAFRAARQRAGEPVQNLTFEVFRRRLAASEQNLRDQHACRLVRFEVLIRQHKVTLRPQLIR